MIPSCLRPSGRLTAALMVVVTTQISIKSKFVVLADPTHIRAGVRACQRAFVAGVCARQAHIALKLALASKLHLQVLTRQRIMKGSDHDNTFFRLWILTFGDSSNSRFAVSSLHTNSMVCGNSCSGYPSVPDPATTTKAAGVFCGAS